MTLSQAPASTWSHQTTGADVVLPLLLAGLGVTAVFLYGHALEQNLGIC